MQSSCTQRAAASGRIRGVSSIWIGPAGRSEASAERDTVHPRGIRMTAPNKLPRRRQLSGKADAYLLSASRDLTDAADLALRHLEVTASGLSNASSERAFTQAMIVSYMSPWSEKVNPATKEVYDLLDLLDDDETRLHERLRHLRNNLVAHTNRELSDPAIQVENDAQMFSRATRVLRHPDVVGTWSNACKMRNHARALLRQRYPKVFPITHEVVGVLEPIVSAELATKLAAKMGPRIVELLEHGWRDCDLVTLDEAAQRLHVSPENLAEYSVEASRRRADFPSPFPLNYPDRPGPLWRMSWIREWAATPLEKMGT